MQINYFESNDGKLPLILTGYKDKMDEFLQKYQLKIVEEENITKIANSSLNKQIVKAIISKSELRRIMNQSEISDFSLYTKPILWRIGIQPTQYFSLEEWKAVSNKSKQLMYNELKESLGVKTVWNLQNVEVFRDTNTKNLIFDKKSAYANWFFGYFRKKYKWCKVRKGIF